MTHHLQAEFDRAGKRRQELQDAIALLEREGKAYAAATLRRMVVEADRVVRRATGPEVGVSVMPRVAGRPFVCECGCNVFTKVGVEYRCNACPNVYGEAR